MLHEISRFQLSILLRIALLFFLWCSLSFAQESLTTVFSHVNVIPMDRDTVLHDQTVIVESGRIVVLASRTKPVRQNPQRQQKDREYQPLPDAGPGRHARAFHPSRNGRDAAIQRRNLCGREPSSGSAVCCQRRNLSAKYVGTSCDS